MKRLLILLTAGALTGCASAPPDPWLDLAAEPPTATMPPTCGEFPLPTAVEAAGIVYDANAVRALDIWKECAEASITVALERTREVNQHRIAEAALIDAGKHQRRIAELRREMLDDERKARGWERLQYWFLLGILGAAAL